jgi:hypothetical protein
MSEIGYKSWGLIAVDDELTGLAADALNRCADSPWEIHYDSYYAQIQTTIVNPAPFIKLHYIGTLGSVITRINFSTP